MSPGGDNMGLLWARIDDVDTTPPGKVSAGRNRSGGRGGSFGLVDQDWHHKVIGCYLWCTRHKNMYFYLNAELCFSPNSLHE